MAQNRWKIRFYRFLRVKPLCNLVFKVRWLWFVIIRRKLVSHPDMRAVDGHNHNLKGILDGKPSDRILKLIMPMSVIDRLTPESTVLAIGCRYETDLLYLAAHGFDPARIRGLDMLSYSPWVELGNMHNMEFRDGSWDAVLLGWVLTYSNNPRQAAKEVVRVVRDGGIVAIGITTYPDKYLDNLKKKDRVIGTTADITSTDDILELFDDHVDKLYFRHDRSEQDRQGACLVIFSVKK